MPKQRVLYVSSNHPAIRPGGLEGYTLDLYEAFRDSDEFEPVFLARAGPPFTEPTRYHGWSPFAMVERRPEPVPLLHEHVRGSLGLRPAVRQVGGQVGADPLLPRLPARPAAGHRPLPAHDLPRLRPAARDQEHAARRADRLHAARVRADLPSRRADGPHDATRSCARRSRRGAATSASRTISPQTFYMRKRFIQSHLSLVDLFIAPSDYVRDRYVDWGIPRREDPGRAAGHAAGHGPRARGGRDAAAQPLRVLRPVHPLQGRRRAAGGDGASSATTSTATSGSTARTSRSSRSSSGSGSRRCWTATASTVTFAGPYERSRPGQA